MVSCLHYGRQRPLSITKSAAAGGHHQGQGGGVSSNGAENWNKLTARPPRRPRIGLFSQRVHFHGRCGAILLSLRCAS